MAGRFLIHLHTGFPIPYKKSPDTDIVLEFRESSTQVVELILQTELTAKSGAKIVSYLGSWTIFRISAAALLNSGYILSDLRDHSSKPKFLNNLSEFPARGVIFNSLPDNIEDILRLSTADIPMSRGRTEIIKQGRHNRVLLAGHLLGEDKYVLTHSRPRALK